MRYEDLDELLAKSSSTRRYFLTLPVELQMTLHAHNGAIHSAEALHRYAEAAVDYAKRVWLSQALF